MPGLLGSDKLLQRLDRLDALLGQIEDGKKLLLDPRNPDDKPVIDLLDDMGARGDLAAPASFYYVTPQDDDAAIQIKQKVSTGSRNVRLLKGDWTRERQEIQKALSYDGITNAQVLGAHFVVERRADNFVLPPRGGLGALKEAVDLFRAAVTGRSDHTKKPFTLVIDNGSARWMPLLVLLGLGDKKEHETFNKRFANGRQFFHLSVADGLEEVGTAIAHYGVDPVRDVAPPQRVIAEGQVPTLTFATGNTTKEEDAIKIVSSHNFNAAIVPSRNAGGHDPSAKEFTGTFAWNAADKALTAARGKFKEPEKFDRALAKLQTDRAHTIMFAADGGGIVHPSLWAQPEFNAVRNEVVPGMPAPGVENKGVVTGLGSAEQYYGALIKARDRLDPNHKNRDLGRVQDTCVWAAVKMDEADPSNLTCYVYEDVAFNYLAPAAAPATDIIKEDKHYTVPEWSEGQTVAELEAANDPRVWTQTAFARSLIGFLEETGASKGAPRLTANFNRQAQGNLRVLVNHQLADTPISQNELLELETEFARVGGIELMRDVHKPRSLMKARETMERADVYVYLQGDSRMDLLTNADMLARDTVGHQIKDPMFETKVSLHLRDDVDDRSVVTRFFDHGTMVGLIGDRHDRHIKTVTSARAAAEFIKAATQNYRRPTPPPYRPLPKLPFRPGQDTLTVLLSASTGISEYLDDYINIGVIAGYNNINLYDGGGRHSGMGLVKYGYLVGQKLRTERGWVADGLNVGIQDPYTVITEGSPKEFLKPENFIVANNIDEREQLISLVDPIIAELKSGVTPGQHYILAAAGGAGTMKEKITTLLAKRMAIESGQIPALPNLHFITQNHPRTLIDGTVAAPFDIFEKYIGAEYKNDPNYHVVETVLQAFDLMGRIRGRSFDVIEVNRGDVGFYPFEEEKNPNLAEICPPPYSQFRKDHPGPC